MVRPNTANEDPDAAGITTKTLQTENPLGIKFLIGKGQK